MKKRATKVSLEEMFELVKIRIMEESLSIEEIAKHTGVDEKLIVAFLDENTDIVAGLSRIIAFMKFSMYPTKLLFNTYHISQGETQCKISRKIYPKCSITYDIPSDIFFNFKLKSIKQGISKVNKALIISEMQEFYDEYCKKLRTPTKY